MADLYSLIRKYRSYYTSLPTADNRSRFQKHISDLLYSEFQQVLPEQDRTAIIQEEFTKLVEVHTTSGDTTDVKTQATKHFRRLFLNSATKKKVEDYIDNNTFFGSSIYTSLHHRYLAKAGEVIDEEIASRKTPSPEAPFYTAADTAFISEGGPSTFKPPSPIRRTEEHQLPTPSTGGPIVFESPSILYSREASPEKIQTSVATVIPPPSCRRRIRRRSTRSFTRRNRHGRTRSSHSSPCWTNNSSKRRSRHQKIFQKSKGSNSFHQ